jgi:hypothetical protein
MFTCEVEIAWIRAVQRKEKAFSLIAMQNMERIETIHNREGIRHPSHGVDGWTILLVFVLYFLISGKSSGT